MDQNSHSLEIKRNKYTWSAISLIVMLTIRQMGGATARTGGNWHNAMQSPTHTQPPANEGDVASEERFQKLCSTQSVPVTPSTLILHAEPAAAANNGKILIPAVELPRSCNFKPVRAVFMGGISSSATRGDVLSSPLFVKTKEDGGHGEGKGGGDGR